MSRVERRDRLFSELGFLIRPIQELLDDPTGPPHRVATVRALFKAEYNDYMQDVLAVCREDRFQFDVEFGRVKETVWQFAQLLDQYQRNGNLDSARRRFELARAESEKAVRAIPAEDPDEIFPSATPFAAYRRIRALCAAAGSKVELFDPWLDADAFHLYVGEVRRSTPIVVVTGEALMSPRGQRDAARKARLLAVSTLMSIERPDSYRFLVSSEIHDRHLRIDGSVYHLGGSLKDAGKTAAYTLAGLDSTVMVNGVLDRIVAAGRELYGPTTGAHLPG